MYVFSYPIKEMMLVVLMLRNMKDTGSHKVGAMLVGGKRERPKSHIGFKELKLLTDLIVCIYKLFSVTGASIMLLEFTVSNMLEVPLKKSLPESFVGAYVINEGSSRVSFVQ